MNTQPRTTIIQLTIATFVWFAAFPCIAQGTLYRLTGTVIDIGISESFTLDLGLIPGTVLQVGDPVTGTIEVLSNRDAVTTATTINNPKPDDPAQGVLFRPLGATGDAYILNISQTL